MVSLIDMYPTLLDLCGLPTNPKNEGRSLTPLLERPSKVWNHPSLTTLFRYNHSVTTEQYRYIRYEDGSEELYNRQADPNEWTNLAGKKSLKGVKQRLAKHLPN